MEGTIADRISDYLQLCKLKVVGLIVFTAVVGMFLAVPGLPPLGIPQPTATELGDDPESWKAVVSRNAPCPCGSGRKYKHCHGALA